MPRGGPRPGSGRKAGSPNKATAELKAAAVGGEMPAEYMLRVMRDPTIDHDRRDKMAVAASPYYHAKLANIEHTGKDGGSISLDVQLSDIEAARRVAYLLAAGRKQAGKSVDSKD